MKGKKLSNFGALCCISCHIYIVIFYNSRIFYVDGYCNTLYIYFLKKYFFCRFNIFKGCKNAKTCTMLLRGGAEQFLEETERSLHDAIMIVRRTIKNDAVVAGTSHSEDLCFYFSCI